MARRRFDVLVLGVGGMGSAVCCELARRGLRVAGLEQFQIGHDRGSSHGRSRVIRKAYFEDPRYVPLLHEVFGLWRELEAETGGTLLRLTGCLNMGPADHLCIRGVKASAQVHGLAHEVLDAVEIRRRWPVLKLNDDDAGLFESEAGFLVPERCVAAHVNLARQRGATFIERQRIDGWSAAAGAVRVACGDETFEAGHLIITAGAWLPSVAADLGLPLSVERQVQVWMRPAAAGAFAAGAMPVFIHFLTDRAYYGVPHHGDGLVKFARHHGGLITTADDVDRAVADADVADVRAYLRRHVPAADGPPADAKVCLYTNTPDDHFLIDRHPRHDNVIIAGGFSGHGFKFAPVVGRIVADLVLEGRTHRPIEMFALARLWRRRPPPGSADAVQTPSQAV